MTPFNTIQTIIQEVAKDSILGVKLSEARLQQEWEGLVGQTMAKHSYPESIRYKKLYLIADNSIWLQQLLFLKPTILEAIHTLFPDLELTEIILRLGTVPDRPTLPDPPPKSSGNTPILPSPVAVALTKDLTDSDLQTLLSQTITKALSQPPPPTLEKT